MFQLHPVNCHICTGIYRSILTVSALGLGETSETSQTSGAEMSDTYRVMVHGKPEIRELAFAFEPRVGDLVRLPDLDGDLHFQVDKVVHSARLPHSNEVPSVYVVIVPEKPRNAQRT